MIEFSANDDDPTSGTRGANSEVGTHLLAVPTMLARQRGETTLPSLPRLFRARSFGLPAAVPTNRHPTKAFCHLIFFSSPLPCPLVDSRKQPFRDARPPVSRRNYLGATIEGIRGEAGPFRLLFRRSNKEARCPQLSGAGIVEQLPGVAAIFHSVLTEDGEGSVSGFANALSPYVPDPSVCGPRNVPESLSLRPSLVVLPRRIKFVTLSLSLSLSLFPPTIPFFLVSRSFSFCSSWFLATSPPRSLSLSRVLARIRSET